jgi:hypothetical protein
MPAFKSIVLVSAILALGAFGLALAADFTQPERTPDFVKSCRRQDNLLKHAFGDLVPTAVNFCHRGSFKALVHRLGLSRPVTLIPVQYISYASLEEFREAARKKALVVGAMNITYPLPEANIIPGAHILMYDGVNLRVLDAHGYAVTDLAAALEPPAADAQTDPIVGTVANSPHSIANIASDGKITLYLQLRSGSREVRNTAGFVKVALTANVNGLVTDDKSPDTTLAKPEEKDTNAKDTNKTGE